MKLNKRIGIVQHAGSQCVELIVNCGNFEFDTTMYVNFHIRVAL